MKQIQLLFLVITFVATSMMNAQENLGTVNLPSTISQEARAILRGWTIEGRNAGANLPKADAPKEVWTKIQKEYADVASEFVPIVVENYRATIDTLFLGGIRAISVTPKNYQNQIK